MPKIICVVGPTASGKTALAVKLAKHYGGEVLSCDSMQIYKGMDIGTAKPTEEEMQGVPHHMLSVADPREPFSVGKYVSMATPIVDDILARGRTAVIAGGTGLYADSLILGREFSPMPSTGIREMLEKRADAEGCAALLRELAGFDPEAAAHLHERDRKRILRAMEVYLETGKTITQHNAESRLQPPRYRAAWLGLTYSDRKALYDRIDLRVEQMFRQGLPEEVQQLVRQGMLPPGTALAAIGYKELAAAFRGEMTMEEAAAAVKQASRRYAKRQLTWFRRNREIFWLDRSRLSDDTLFSAARQYLGDFDSHR